MIIGAAFIFTRYEKNTTGFAALFGFCPDGYGTKRFAGV